MLHCAMVTVAVSAQMLENLHFVNHHVDRLFINSEVIHWGKEFVSRMWLVNLRRTIVSSSFSSLPPVIGMVDGDSYHM
jgi:hypothetical protein